MNIIQKSIVNYAKGRQGERPEIVVIHIGEGNSGQILGKANFKEKLGAFTYEQKSSHYLVNYDGSVWQFVKEENTAWHAGLKVNPTTKLVLAKKEKKKKNPNLYPIGIEHEVYGHTDITEEQYKVSAQLIREICLRWNITIDREHIIGHREIRADKTCPGKIDVDKLIRLAIYEEPKKDDPKVVENLELQLTLLQKVVALLKQLLGIK